jgi:hypothetical protein
MEENDVWYNRKYLVLFLSVIVWPVGFYGLYKSQTIPRKIKQTWTIGFLITIGLVNFLQSIQTEPPENQTFEKADLAQRCKVQIEKLAALDKECRGLKNRSNEGLYDIPNLISEYQATKDSITAITANYIQLCFNKNNDKVKELIDTRVQQLEDKLPVLRKKAELQNQKYLQEQRNSVGEMIINRIYENNSNGLLTQLKFVSAEGYKGRVGALTLTNNASRCKYVFSYNVYGNDIEAVFYDSDCGARSSDRTFTYDEQTHSIYCFINGRRFDFY